MPISLNGSSGITTPAVTSTTAIGTASGGTNLGGATPFTSGGVVYASSTSALATGSALTFDGTNLGIGVTPTVKLDILNTNATYSLSQKIFNASAGTFFLGQSPSATFLSVDNFSMAFCTNSNGGVAGTSVPTNERMRISSAGNVGIGTSSPTSLLHISADATATIELDSTNSGRGNFYIQSKVVGNTNWFQIGEDTGGDFFTIMSDNNGTGGNAGNVGIGTTTPSAKLQVGATSDTSFAMSNSTSVTSGNRGTIYMYNSADATVGAIRFLAVTDNVGTEIQFYTRPAAGSLTQTMTLTATGQLGIGTTSPTNMLDVRGTNPIIRVEPNVSTDAASFQAINDSKISYFGRENSVGNYFFSTNVTPYSTVLSAYNSTAPIIFGHNSPEVYLQNGGLFAIGTTTAVSGNTNARLVVKSSGVADACEIQVVTNGVLAFDFRNSSGTQAGSIVVNASSVNYNTSSDYRLKNTIAPMTGALAKVAQLKPVTYKWNVDDSDGEGFIAHELAEVCPSAVTGAKDALDANGNIKPQGIDVSFLVATLTAALQELDAKFEAYKASHP